MLTIYSIINAQLVLSYINNKRFGDCFQAITGSLNEDGVFVGQLFGVDDSWNSKYTSRIFLKRDEVDELLKDFDVLFFEEVKGYGYDVFKRWKFWHIFHFIVRR